MYLCVKGIDCASFYDFDILFYDIDILFYDFDILFYDIDLLFWDCSDSNDIFFFFFSFYFYRYIILIKMVVFALLVYFREFYPTFYVLSYYVSLRSEFRVVMSLTISVRYVFTSICL